MSLQAVSRSMHHLQRAARCSISRLPSLTTLCQKQRDLKIPTTYLYLNHRKHSSLQMRTLNPSFIVHWLKLSPLRFFQTSTCVYVEKQESSRHESVDKSSDPDEPPVIDVFDENNITLGSMSKDEAVQVSKNKKLQLVCVNADSRPYPMYRLMSLDQAEEFHSKEQLKKKLKVREIRLTCGIGDHDLEVKRKQMGKWFEDPKFDTQVKVVVKGGKTWKPVTEKEQLDVVNKLMAGFKDRVTFEHKPKLTGKNNPSLTAQFRLMSVKEKAQYNKLKNKK